MGGGRPGLDASCVYKVTDGLQVKTDTDRVKRARKIVFELLLARCPDATRIKDLAAEYGVTDTRITLAKREQDRLHARRLVHRDIRDPKVVKKLFDTLGARYTERPGGYTRILKLGPRGGDGAEMAIVELLGSEFKPKKKDEKEAKKKAAKA